MTKFIALFSASLILVSGATPSSATAADVARAQQAVIRLYGVSAKRTMESFVRSKLLAGAEGEPEIVAVRRLPEVVIRTIQFGNKLENVDAYRWTAMLRHEGRIDVCHAEISFLTAHYQHEPRVSFSAEFSKPWRCEPTDGRPAYEITHQTRTLDITFDLHGAYQLTRGARQASGMIESDFSNFGFLERR